MHGVAQASTWVVLILAMFALATGGVTIAREKVALAWLRYRVCWRPWAWGQVLFGVFLMLETIPRLAHSPAALVLGLSFVALAPLAGSVALYRSARLRRP
jgi:hypothetical protein